VRWPRNREWKPPGGPGRDRRLSPVKGRVDGEHEIARGAGILRKSRDADADGHIHVFSGIQPDRATGNAAANALGDRHRFVGVGFRSHHDKFIATVAGDEIARPHLTVDRPGDIVKRLVAGQMTVFVVDGLQIVEIEDEQGQGSPVTVRPLDFLIVEPAREFTPVKQAGEFVANHQFFEFDQVGFEPVGGGVERVSEPSNLIVVGETHPLRQIAGAQAIGRVPQCCERSENRAQYPDKGAHSKGERIAGLTTDLAEVQRNLGVLGSHLVNAQNKFDDVDRGVTGLEHKLAISEESLGRDDDCPAPGDPVATDWSSTRPTSTRPAV